MGHTWSQYVIRAPDRNALKEFLAQRGIGRIAARLRPRNPPAA